MESMDTPADTLKFGIQSESLTALTPKLSALLHGVDTISATNKERDVHKSRGCHAPFPFTIRGAYRCRTPVFVRAKIGNFR